MLIDYARVSTDEPRLDAQLVALSATGAEHVFSDQISGSWRNRPELDRMLDLLRSGDVVIVTKYDRLARWLHDLLEIADSAMRSVVAVSISYQIPVPSFARKTELEAIYSSNTAITSQQRKIQLRRPPFNPIPFCGDAVWHVFCIFI